MTNPVELFVSILEEFNNDPKWTNSLFGKIKTINNTKVGSVGERFIERLCGELYLLCSFPTNVLGKRKTQGVGVELFGWSETIYEDWNLLITAVCIIAAFGGVWLVFRYLDKLPAEETFVSPPPPPTFDGK